MCEAFETLAWLADDELDAAERAALGAHLPSCGSCREVRLDVPALRAALPLRIHELAKRLAASQRPPLRVSPRGARGAWAIAGAAAALLFALGGAELLAPSSGETSTPLPARLVSHARSLPRPRVRAVATSWTEPRFADSRGAARDCGSPVPSPLGRASPPERRPLALGPSAAPILRPVRSFSAAGQPAEVWVVCLRPSPATPVTPPPPAAWESWLETPAGP